MENGLLAVLDEEPPPPSAGTFAARRTRPVLAGWRLALWLAEWSGRFLRRLFVHWLFPLVGLLLGVALLWATQNDWVEAGIATGVGFVLALGAAAWTARQRLLIGDFSDPSAPEGIGAGLPRAAVDLANLLQVELSRLASLFRVVEDRRAVWSGLGPARALDATLSVDDLVETLQGTVSAETKVSLGPVSIPVAPLMALAGRAVRAPRLTGSLHRDGHVLILTAQQTGPVGFSWRVSVTASSPEAGTSAPSRTEAVASDETAVLSAMVSELALRIFTDLALGREVRWEASRSFVRGLHHFRACLRTPKDRKVNLKEAERLFLDALSEDEDFPLVYYNLGIVYTELHGLADAAGRTKEATMHLSAAETSFGRAIDKDPTRWENYLALAQTQLRYSRYGTVIELCERVKQVDHRAGDLARAYELRARALLLRAKDDDLTEAIKYARKATAWGLWSLFRARISRKVAPGDDNDRVPMCAELAGACALTFGDCYSRQLPGEAALPKRGLRRWRREGMVRRAISLFRLARKMSGRVAHIHFALGLRALARGFFELAEEELEAAIQSDPTRPAYASALALARARRAASFGPTVPRADREDIARLSQRALHGMAGAFFPSRDVDASELLARVYDELGGESPAERQIAAQLRDVGKRVQERLAKAASGASVSAFFLEELYKVKPPWRGELGEYGSATLKARSLLLDAREEQARERKTGNGNREPALTALRKALEQAERATSLNPLSSLAWETLGDAHRELSDFRNARTAWTYALSRDPDNPQLYDKVGESHWQLAFQARSGFSAEDLEAAARCFDRALLLYGSGSFDEQIRTHYRLGKLYAAMWDFANAQAHLQIVEAVAINPPLVGWQLLGLAHLRERNHSECEYHFACVISQGDALARDRDEYPPDKIIGDRLDEELWPLALVRAWGRLALAFSYAEREGNLSLAARNVDEARECARELPNFDSFSTRIHAACDDCEGFIQYRKGNVDKAIVKLRKAIGESPWSRSYLNLALAYEERARTNQTDREADLRTAMRLLDHATRLRPTTSPSPEIQSVRTRLDASLN